LQSVSQQRKRCQRGADEQLLHGNLLVIVVAEEKGRQRRPFLLLDND